MGKNVKVLNTVYRLRQAHTLEMPGYTEKLNFDSGQEFHIIADVLYMGGHPLPLHMQLFLTNWITSNTSLFVGDTRNF
jgi:hypothetical protein